jgi:hypothetical protein
MSMKRTDLAKQVALKVRAQMKTVAVPGRFGDAATEVLDKREQRRRDAAAGLVPFACKLPAEQVSQLSERASAHPGGINGLVTELLAAALK